MVKNFEKVIQGMDKGMEIMKDVIMDNVFYWTLESVKIKSDNEIEFEVIESLMARPYDLGDKRTYSKYTLTYNIEEEAFYNEDGENLNDLNLCL